MWHLSTNRLAFALPFLSSKACRNTSNHFYSESLHSLVLHPLSTASHTLCVGLTCLPAPHPAAYLFFQLQFSVLPATRLGCVRLCYVSAVFIEKSAACSRKNDFTSLRRRRLQPGGREDAEAVEYAGWAAGPAVRVQPAEGGQPPQRHPAAGRLHRTWRTRLHHHGVCRAWLSEVRGGGGSTESRGGSWVRIWVRVEFYRHIIMAIIILVKTTPRKLCIVFWINQFCKSCKVVVDSS